MKIKGVGKLQYFPTPFRVLLIIIIIKQAQNSPPPTPSRKQKAKRIQRDEEMASFAEAPPGDSKVGEKIFKTKCAQCHTVDKGAGHKQGNFIAPLFLFWSYIFEVKLSFILLIIMFSAPIIRRSNLFRWTELWSFFSLSLSLMGLRFLQENHDFGERWNWV